MWEYPQVNVTLDKPQLLADAMRLADCNSFEEVQAELHHLSNKLGFDAFSYSGRFSVDGARKLNRTVSNYDEGWLRRYERLGYARIDPTVLHAHTSLRPLVWSDSMYVTDLQRDFQEDARAHGLVTGATFPIHSKEGEIAMLSLSLMSNGSAAQRHVHEMLVWGPLMATLAHEAMRLIVKNAQAAVRPKLTQREAEVLQWIALGKSTWEISRLIHISEHGVTYHVRNLMLKFNVTTRNQAVVKAIAFGLL